LAVRESEIVSGHPVVASRYILFSELIDDLMLDYLHNDRKNTVNLAWKLQKNVLPFFGRMLAVSISSTDIADYVDLRRKGNDKVKPASNATINRELAAIRRAFSIAQINGKLSITPKIQLLKESAPRSGFFTIEEVEKILEHLPAYLHPVIWFAFYTGWRKSEILNLQWSHVDLVAGEIRIPPGESKNDDPRIFPMTKPLKDLLKTQPTDCDYVFSRSGQRIIDFRTAWENALAKAELSHRVFHDFRRTAARNMSRQGIPERVAMQMMGQKTRHIYDRYRIVSEQDLKDARKKMEKKSS